MSPLLYRLPIGLLKEAQVSAYQQKTEWSCSAATLKAVALHHGVELSEGEIVKAIGARKGRGAETTDIMNGAKKLGFDAYEGSFANLDDAKKTLKKGIPIIADVQSFNYPGKGHYIVIAGFKPGQGFIVMDPNTKGKTAIDNWRLMSAEELEEKWWDRAMAPPHKLMRKWGVMVKPKDKEKTANGDMMQYFADNPQKLKEYQARQAAKKKGKKRVLPWGREMTAQERFVASRSPKTKEKNAMSTALNRVLIGGKERGVADTYSPNVLKGVEALDKAIVKVKEANDPIKEKLTLHGIPLALEWRKGEVRKYFNHNPLKKKSTGTIDYNKKMEADYGYVRNVMDADGEELDVYIGPNRDSEKIFVLEKLRSSDASFDENKIMLGYDSMAEAKKSYLRHQDKDEMGKVREITLAQFKKEFLSKKEKKASGDSNEALRKEKQSQGDILGRNAMRRAKAESASAHPGFGKYARFSDELCKIANPAGTARQAFTMGAKVGGGFSGLREVMNEDNSPGEIKRIVKGIGAGAMIGALIALGLQRNAMGKTTLPWFK